MLPRLEIVHRQNSYQFYTVHEDNYTSSFQMTVDGELGVVYTLNGDGFIRLTATTDFLEQIFKEAGIMYMTFSMLAPLLRVLKRSLDPKCTFQELYTFDKNGRAFTRVFMSLK